METTKRDAVIAEAKRDAAAFVEEFNEPLDPAQTDWDGVAWEDVDVQMTDEEAAELWPVYQEALVAETERLCN